MRDWIQLIEIAYCLDGDLCGWLGRLASAAAPVLDDGGGVTALAFHAEPGGVAIEHVAACGGPPGLAEMAASSNREAGSSDLDLVYRSGIPAATLSEVLADRPETLEIVRRATGGLFEDTLGIVAHAGGGRGVAITTPLPRARKMTDRERTRWTRVALHVGAAHRLRSALAPSAGGHASIEAVLDPDGAVREASGAATAPSAREILRQAVRRAERARRPEQRSDPDKALALWSGLVQGRWSLVDHFSDAGQRFVVAHRNEPTVEDPRGLAPRELQTAELLGFGYAPKEIAYALGLTKTTVDKALARARGKLGLTTPAELAAFFAPDGPRARLAELEVAGQSWLVGRTPLLDADALSQLSEAERHVALRLLQGATNRAIAIERGTAERTVANQVQAIFRKLGVNSRAELAAVSLGARARIGNPS